MIKSMTAFARQQRDTELGAFTWELRSVNHRHLEVSLRIGEAYRPLEMSLRKIISARLSRGKIDATLRYESPENQASGLATDTTLVNAILQQCDSLASQSEQVAKVDPLAILQWPGVLQTMTPDLDALAAEVASLLSVALDDLVATRETEGAALQGMIIQRCREIDAISNKARERMPIVLATYRAKLNERIAEMQANVDPERLEQELVLLAQKTDVAEELDRLQTHVAEVGQVLQRNEPVGRRLDFLMQELNREANTLASKSIDTEMTNMSVELKVLIEQMREQIQNIE